MDDETNDTASNPLDEAHLPVGGEVDAPDGDPAPDINHDMQTDDPTPTDPDQSADSFLASG